MVGIEVVVAVVGFLIGLMMALYGLVLHHKTQQLASQVPQRTTQHLAIGVDPYIDAAALRLGVGVAKALTPQPSKAELVALIKENVPVVDVARLTEFLDARMKDLSRELEKKIDHALDDLAKQVTDELDFEEVIGKQLQKSMRGITTNMKGYIIDAMHGDADDAAEAFAKDSLGHDINEIASWFEGEGHRHTAALLRRGPRYLPVALKIIGAEDAASAAVELIKAGR